MSRQTTEVDKSGQPNLGDQELALLRFVEDAQLVSARDAVDKFGEPNGLARTTVITMLERLRKKRVLQRTKKGGVFVYRMASGQDDLLQGVVKTFVERTLGGSVIPFAAYLAQSKSLTGEEIDALQRAVDAMRQQEAQHDDV